MTSENSRSRGVGNGGQYAVLTLVLCILCLSAAVLLSGMPLNHDSALLLQCGQLITGGSTPFVDYFEVQLHITQYLHIPPVLLAGAFHLDLPVTFQASVLAFVIYSCFAVFLLLRKARLFETTWGSVLMASSILIVSLQVLRAGEFGQREHLFVLGYLPFLTLRILRYRDMKVRRVMAVTIGFLAVVTMLGKPSFLMMGVLVELYMRLRTRRSGMQKKPEMITVYCVMVLLALHYLVLPGSLNSPFFGRWLPLIVSNYSVYDNPLGTILLWNIRILTVLAAGIITGLFYVRRMEQNRRIAGESLIAASVIGAAGFFAQSKGWFYHLIPAVAPVYMLVMLMAASWLSERKSARKADGIGGRLLVIGPLIVCLLLAVDTFRLAENRYPGMSDFVELIECYSNEGEAISFIGTDVFPKYPTLIYTDRMPGTRFSTGLPIAMFRKDRSGSAHPHLRDEVPTDPEERRFLMELGSDIVTNRPAIVFLQSSGESQGCPGGFSVLEYLDRWGWMELYMGQYSFLEEVDGYRAYVLNGDGGNAFLGQE